LRDRDMPDKRNNDGVCPISGTHGTCNALHALHDRRKRSMKPSSPAVRRRKSSTIPQIHPDILISFNWWGGGNYFDKLTPQQHPISPAGRAVRPARRSPDGLRTSVIFPGLFSALRAVFQTFRHGSPNRGDGSPNQGDGSPNRGDGSLNRGDSSPNWRDDSPNLLRAPPGMCGIRFRTNDTATYPLSVYSLI
jgi:hypothetical protein